MKKWMLMAGIVALMLTACEKKKTDMNDLNGEWNVTEINDAPVQKGVHPWIGFNVAEKRVYGNLGANSVIGVLGVGKEPGSIDLSKLGTTMMMGTPEQMSVEDLLSKTLATVKTFSMRHDGKLELRNAAGKKVVILEKRTAPKGGEAVAPKPDANNGNAEMKPAADAAKPDATTKSAAPTNSNTDKKAEKK